ncbi:MAG: hypothetical protein A4E65_03485 [Syntrophorhabdus sp. PtaU1.Bin153]|nr:MAG: hypothetical protein A4E65_03485 [Syntrophorhabdus sp. PtaU1.Bin153]
MVILTHHTGESHSILGAQVAATYITRRLNIRSMVVGVKRGFSRDHLVEFLDEHYREQAKIICFSHLCGRKDLVDLIGLLKERGFRTVLGGPQAAQDFIGEDEVDTYPLRFRGLKGVIDMAFSGPIDFLTRDHLVSHQGCLRFPWKRDIFLEVDWSNLYIFSDKIERLAVEVGQVFNVIGCPYAKKRRVLLLDPPGFLGERGFSLNVETCGCTFCDVARDKGFHGYVDDAVLRAQIRSLPEKDGRKITFEMIDELPLGSLGRVLRDVDEEGIRLSRVDLVCRVNDINTHEELLGDILKLAKNKGIRIMFSSIGFESFSDRILKNFNKGITTADIVKCVTILRKMKRKFNDTLLYRTDEGANHGFIHPTPWDADDTAAEIESNIGIYQFFDDILPEHSIPLIIHHASYLGDWIRGIESKTDVRFKRDGTWIEWWAPPAPVRETI